jgi:dienelactone hydrolase
LCNYCLGGLIAYAESPALRSVRRVIACYGEVRSSPAQNERIPTKCWGAERYSVLEWPTGLGVLWKTMAIE